MQFLGEDRQFAGLGPLQFAIDADDVAQIETLGQFQFSGPTWFWPMNS